MLEEHAYDRSVRKGRRLHERGPTVARAFINDRTMGEQGFDDVFMTICSSMMQSSTAFLVASVHRDVIAVQELQQATLLYFYQVREWRNQLFPAQLHNTPNDRFIKDVRN